ncbi:MAG TPA: bifunctional 3,4-dihydroxy-2-butanone-4-phosphate synthase/GTP cyclohydrolase II [Sulfurihydrogenibium sp.]|uniref:bifunctional 3,4-dihydroxy-2-butanone-4-phosphate synthase/GTP cyclohydrolase II n=1 Tax=Sulfurihydrogenibium sp. (strain YO3AOP1) TaxID=436114 RepID=UPI0001723291|nr:bifunctional 3,4-dihydroxy-2-butanone-4-phosphate synthase/GTP cyclohydrolase II [Sulfurihydrogenibium sp. YO3AOP1]ACD67356.1 3,4-dihydroxy-2-butanone 4-phosphate synthase [Sulfurihydrogenibium sp. YO3AOP1]HBT99142.1 bifunctional 3,4-dihydroxy-2-butanone-4-phosphate synthase/GTP cyclohydrolase II [Sulfurihydrogenibium sp.]
MTDFKFNTIDEAIEDILNGKMVIVVDDPDRENEGDLVCAAEKVTPEIINFMAKEGRGLICLSMLPERLKELDIQLMTTNNTDPKGTAFCVSIDAHPKYGITTGISAYERATTVKLAVSPEAKPQDFVRPGHVFPLMAKKGGVLERTGHTEASVDLARLAGLYPAGVICEIMKEDGTMARLPDLMEFAKKHNLKIITIADLVKYRLKKEKLVSREAEAFLPTKYGVFKIYGYKSLVDNTEHVALVMGEIREDESVLVRVHSECLTGDIFGSLRCDCQNQLHLALKKIAEEGKGVLVYMRGHEGRGIGIINKLKAYRLQDEGYDTVEANHKLGFNADLRDFGTGAQILLDLGVKKMRLMTNNPRKIVALEGFGLEIVERVPIVTQTNPHNEKYIKAKKDKLGHMIEGLEDLKCDI